MIYLVYQLLRGSDAGGELSAVTLWPRVLTTSLYPTGSYCLEGVECGFTIEDAVMSWTGRKRMYWGWYSDYLVPTIPNLNTDETGAGGYILDL